jgi:predicted AAA+ superfamily ATPase
MGFAPKYWRTKSKAEVDFVVERGGEVVPIEVKLQVGRKVGTGLRSFIGRYAPGTAIVVGLKGEEGSRVVEGCEVRFFRVSSLWREMTCEAVTEHQDER